MAFLRKVYPKLSRLHCKSQFRNLCVRQEEAISRWVMRLLCRSCLALHNDNFGCPPSERVTNS